MNFDYLDRYKEKGNIYDIVRFLGYSSDIQNDVEELINDGYYYAYYCDGEFYHAHSLKPLLVDIAQMIIDNPDVEIVLADDDYYSRQNKNKNEYIKNCTGGIFHFFFFTSSIQNCF